jgi:hypothetical protein
MALSNTCQSLLVFIKLNINTIHIQLNQLTHKTVLHACGCIVKTDFVQKIMVYVNFEREGHSKKSSHQNPKI